MRRSLVVLVTLFLTLALASPVVAGPGGKADPPADPIALTGVTTFGAIEARTGEYAGTPGFLPGWNHFMDPAFNRCDVVDATLAMTGKNTAVLETWELCISGAPMPPARLTLWDVHIAPSGRVKMEARVAEDVRPAMTGCGMNGPYPVYRGFFDGASLYASTHFHGICDGGLFWGFFGINRDIGPIHATFTVELDVTPG